MPWEANKASPASMLRLPPIIRMSKGRETKIELRIFNAAQQPKTRRIALGWPRQPSSQADEEIDAALPSESEWVPYHRALHAATTRHGTRLSSAYLESGSPFGLWGARKVIPVKSEIRVYPNLLADPKKVLTPLFLNSRFFRHSRAAPRSAKGVIFEKLREYVPGDGYMTKFIGKRPRAGAAHHQGFSGKLKEPRRFTSSWMPLRSMLRESSPGRMRRMEPPFWSVFITAALMLGLLAAEKQGDLFWLADLFQQG